MLQGVKNEASRFPKGEAVAFGGVERGSGGLGDHGEALAAKGAAGAGKLPGVGDEQHGCTGVMAA